MQNNKIPITFREVFKLQALGIDGANIAYDTVKLESDKYICVINKNSEGKGLTIVDIEQQETSSISRAICESAIMHPKTRVIALRAGPNLQTYNLELKSQVKKTVVKETIEFWTWVSVKDIAIVTETSVYHWSMGGDESVPKKMFDKHPSFTGATVVNYKADPTLKWLLLMGFKKEEGFPGGVMQLFSVEKKVTQPINGHAGCFLNFKSGTKTYPLICIASKTKEGGNLFIMELPNGPTTFTQKKVAVSFQNESDFPILMEGSEKYGVIYLITKTGYLYLFDVETANCFYKSRITATPIFTTCPSKNGLLGINREGSVLCVEVNEKTIVPYLIQIGQTQLAMNITSRANLSGADDLYRKKFDMCVQSGQVYEAVMTAAGSPNQILRTPEIIGKLAMLPIPPPPNNKPPLSIYFQYILENVGNLNKFESIELSKIVLQKTGGLEYIKNLIQKSQITTSEELGDLVNSFSAELALKIYYAGKAHHKVVDNLIAKGDCKHVIAYIEKMEDYTPNYLELFGKLLRVSAEAALEFSKAIYQKDATLLNPDNVVNMFVQVNFIKQATAFLLSFLKDDKEENKELQTKLLEINLKYSPVQVADSILGQSLFSHYDHHKIAQLCERVQLYQRALENYSDINDVKRVIVNTDFINHEWLVDFFGDMLPEDSLACLYELLKSNLRKNLKLVVRIASKYSGEISPESLIKMFEHFRSYNGLYYYLYSVVDKTKDADIVFRFIEAAVRCGQLQDVERVTRENDVYDGQKVKEFLKENRIKNMVPLINVCDKHDMVNELIHFLYTNQMTNYIDMYVKQRNPLKTPEVVASLLDCGAKDEYIKSLLVSVGSMCPVQPLVEAVLAKKQLKCIREWLEARVKEGNVEVVTHNALAMIYIDVNHDPETFLRKNEVYDSKEIGAYCVKRRDPSLAFIAYERGQCDLEIIDVTNKNGMFKEQAHYLVRRQDADLWAKVLQEENPHRRLLIDQVVQSALLETRDADEVSNTVHAFIIANLPKELLELLEQIVLKGNTEFKNNKSLQDLLIITAIKADHSRVMGYIKRLDKYNAQNISSIAIRKGLFEEALQVFINNSMHPNAMKVLIENIADLGRAEEYAEKTNDSECFAILGRAQLAEMHTDKAIESFIKANVTQDYREVIGVAIQTEHFKELITFLQLARTQNHHDTHIDTELAYALAREATKNPSPSNYADLEDFILTKQQANVQDVGDRCFREEMYESARILFSAINNWARLASTLVKLGKNRDAVQAAQKADNIKTWKEVMKACVEAKEFRYAQSCGLNIIVHPDEIEDLVYYYESLGYYDECISLLEKGLGLAQEQSHKGIPTALGILYAKYHDEKLMDHLQRYYRRIHTPRLLSICEQNHLWAQMRFLYCSNNNHDEAIMLMMNKVDAWDHNVFTESIIKVINMEKYYQAIDFYLLEHPEQIIDLLQVLTAKSLDHERVAKHLMDSEDLPLLKNYFESVQDRNLFSVNEALNKLYIEEEDFKQLQGSIEHFENFDSYGLARKLESHELLEFRRVSANLYRMNGKFEESIELSKKDKLFKDAMHAAAESNNREIAEKLLAYFVQEKLNECFAGCLVHCYHLVRPDYALELAWKNKIIDMVMPFLVQVLSEYTMKVDTLVAEKKKLEEAQEESGLEENVNVQVQQDTVNPFYANQQGVQPVGVPPGVIPGPVGMGPGIPGGMQGPPVPFVQLAGPPQTNVGFQPFQQ